MKHIYMSIALFLVFSMNVSFAQMYKIIEDVSSVQWIGKKVTGSHDGYITIKSGSIKLQDNIISSGTIVMDMSSITCTDIEDKETRKKLVDHLLSADFFSVEKYPEAKLVITGSSAFINDRASVYGNLTIKGITEPITFEVYLKDLFCKSTIDIDRTKYNVRYGSDSFFDNLGDKAINDIFTINIKLHVERLY